jgi:hypothetical protein
MSLVLLLFLKLLLLIMRTGLLLWKGLQVCLRKMLGLLLMLLLL